MKMYRGSLALGIGVAMVYEDIDPPERQGYINEISRLELFSDEATVTNWSQFAFGASVKVPARVAFDESDIYQPDIIVRAFPQPSWLATTDDVRPLQVNMEEDSVFLNTVRLFLATRDGAIAGVATTVYYRLTVEERKLTDSVRQLINERAYS